MSRRATDKYSYTSRDQGKSGLETREQQEELFEIIKTKPEFSAYRKLREALVKSNKVS
jgi:hypothetical protein